VPGHVVGMLSVLLANTGESEAGIGCVNIE